MDRYFQAVDQYVDLVEDKLGQILEPLADIGYSSAVLLELPFFQQLAKRPPTTGNVIDDYFKLVDYYVSTAERILPFLLQLMTAKSEEFRATKEENKVTILEGIETLAALSKTAQMDVVQLTNGYIQQTLGITSVNLTNLKEYLEGEDLNFNANESLRQWPQIVKEVTYFVSARQIIDEYGRMLTKFIDLQNTDVSTMPSTKQTQFQLAKSLFDKYAQSQKTVHEQLITRKFTKNYTDVNKEYFEAMQDVTEILLYLKGGVSQAFLILRNTNDIDRTGIEERGKLLKQNGVNLVYLDQQGTVLGTALNKFQKIFNQHVEAKAKPQAQSMELKSQNQSTTRDINNAILSANNYNLLEEGGTVIIIAYGQSGSGKTYTLTKLIDYFSGNMNGFTLTGISSVQFYNDVKLQVAQEPKDDIRRLTFPMTDISIPDDPAMRAEIPANGLSKLSRLDPKYDSTKIYDVCKMISLKLKIKPKVTPMNQFQPHSSEMNRIQTFSNKCFFHAEKVNELANTDLPDDDTRSYNRVFEMYRHGIYSMRQSRKSAQLASLYSYVKDGKLHLPIYTFDKDTYIATNLDRFTEPLDAYVCCSTYGMNTFNSAEVVISEADLEELLDLSMKHGIDDLKRTTLKTCEFYQDDTPKKMATELMKHYDEFIKMHRAVHVLCDATPVLFKENVNNEEFSGSVYEINKHFFIKGVWVDVINTSLTPAQARRHEFFRVSVMFENLPHLVGKYKYTIIGSPTDSIQFDQDTKEHITLQRVPDETLGYLVRYGTHTTGKADYMLNKIDYLDSVFDGTFYEKYGDQDTIKFKYPLPPELNKHSGRSVCTIKFEYPPIKTQSKYKNHKSSSYQAFQESSIASYKSFARRVADWQSNPDNYRREFEHCIQISNTGPDNASNYALFDHEELRYQCYFTPADQRTIQSAYSHTFNIPPQHLGRHSLKQMYGVINTARFTRSMPQNPDSSRSQLVTTLHLVKDGKRSQLFFIDLAGNERVDTTKRHIVTPESVYINSTLQFVTEMFLRMKEKYPGWIEILQENGSKEYSSLKNPLRRQVAPPTPDQFDLNIPKETDDPFRRFLYEISTPAAGLKPAIVMVVCAYEYYSSWVPPRPIPEVSRESLQKTFEFISSLFHFGADKAAAIQAKEASFVQEVDPRPMKGGRRRTLHKRIRKTHKKGRRYGTRRAKPRKTRR